MVELSRIVRFALLPAAGSSPDAAFERQRAAGAGAAGNAFAGHPPATHAASHSEIELACVGAPDPQSGYLVDIRAIDRAVREVAAPLIARAVCERPNVAPETLLSPMLAATRAALAPAEVVRLRWRLTPTYALTMETSAMDRVVLQQRFEFAASHRLHVAGLSDERNRALFGKCNHAAGHGHNYHLDVRIEAPLPESGPPALRLPELERLVDDAVVTPFDHKNLNVDVPEFAELNPSVENIARVAHDRIATALERAHPEARLRDVVVWETEKTAAVYPVSPR